MSDAWPPPYTTRRSARAKYLQLQVKATGLEVVLPKHMDQTDVLEFIHAKRRWIEKQLAKRPSQTRHTDLPTQLDIRALAQTWDLHYIATTATRIHCVSAPNQRLSLCGSIDNPSLCYTALIDFIKRQAALFFPRVLHQLCQTFGFHYRSFSIRGQKTRWGSCSAEGDISLNYKLILLPRPLCEHVLLHELCHTIHLNHSARFWALLKHCDPQTQLHRQELKRADAFIPTWLGSD